MWNNDTEISVIRPILRTPSPQPQTEKKAGKQVRFAEPIASYVAGPPADWLDHYIDAPAYKRQRSSRRKGPADGVPAQAAPGVSENEKTGAQAKEAPPSAKAKPEARAKGSDSNAWWALLIWSLWPPLLTDIIIGCVRAMSGAKHPRKPYA